MMSKYKLWFSQKQKRVDQEDPSPKGQIFGLLENGKVIEYTEAISIDSDQRPIWDDAVLLGVGDFFRLGMKQS